MDPRGKWTGGPGSLVMASYMDTLMKKMKPFFKDFIYDVYILLK